MEATITLKVIKSAARRSGADKLGKQLDNIENAVKAVAPGWKVKREFQNDPSRNEIKNEWIYTCEFVLTRSASDAVTRTIRAKAERAAETAADRERWKFIAEDVSEEEEAEAANFEELIHELKVKGLPELNEEVMSTRFRRIYKRDAHIRVIYDNLKLAVKTNFRVRHHILLRGKPACAKSELFLAFKEWFPELIYALDATTMTKAGLETLIVNMVGENRMPPILLIEEIEKCTPENLNSLIQIMDSRGRIQRTNARIGDVSLPCKIVIWATCNDEKALQAMASGAIWSRFSSKLVCQRPDEELMRRILNREIEEIEGKPEWVDTVMDFLTTEVKTNLPEEWDDPRLARALLAGQERLEDGSYLDDFRETHGFPPVMRTFAAAVKQETRRNSPVTRRAHRAAVAA